MLGGPLQGGQGETDNLLMGFPLCSIGNCRGTLRRLPIEEDHNFCGAERSKEPGTTLKRFSSA
jgi:hypothetical protein